MRLNKRRLIAVPVVATFTLFLVAASGARNTPDPRGDAITWRKEHQASLPTTLLSVALLPVEHRKEIAAHLPAVQRTALWREHLNSFLLPAEQVSEVQAKIRADVGELNEAQRRAIAIAYDSLPALFDEAVPVKERQALSNRLCAFGKTVFTRQQGARIFAAIGPLDPPKTSQVATPVMQLASFGAGLPQMLIRAADKVGVAKPLGLKNGGTCMCLYNSWCEASECRNYCDVVVVTGCGCFGLSGCDATIYP